MYAEKEHIKIVKKLNLLKNRILLSDDNELISIVDWDIRKINVENKRLFGKPTTKTLYSIEAIMYVCKSTPIGSNNITFWLNGDYFCTHKGINTLVNWRKHWMVVHEQMKFMGYKLHSLTDTGDDERHLIN
jgi:hypothetical protein